MGQSAGAGSPVWFRCWADRQVGSRGGGTDHRVTLTGRTRPYPHRQGHALGSRSSRTSREYRCSCGHVGWSNHVDLAEMAGVPRADQHR